MSPKEQSQALVLLRQWYERAVKLPRALLTADDVELLDETERFLKPDGPPQESHGQRRG